MGLIRREEGAKDLPPKRVVDSQGGVLIPSNVVKASISLPMQPGVPPHPPLDNVRHKVNNVPLHAPPQAG